MKVCVGADRVGDIEAWQRHLMSLGGGAGRVWHVTRMFPKRRDEILAGGSLYWTIKSKFAVRQAIIDMTPVVADDGTKKCRLDLDPTLVPVEPRPRRPFQGWRYLTAEDAPADLAADDSDGHALRRTLSELGIL